MLAELAIIGTWILIWFIVSFFTTISIKIYQHLMPKKEYVKYSNFFQQWMNVLLVIPLFMP